MNHSAALADLGRWMPLGAITILAVYCLTSIDTSGATHGAPELTAAAVTVAIHLWRRNLVLTLVTGTTVCLILTNWLLPP
jgi:branched-subunit amino acid transport protein AzlD